ncbi:hypothetical protein [Rummeliibacillus pycnus]|uniref:hypothetical protein n=1 Tax=Rummeliibacillus pycnus TaxID=101070 RepID=UPI001FE26AD6|nr:hypothetical protein [Rummeliibacillus pycnus]
MNKKSLGGKSGIISVVLVIVSIIFFFSLRGPDADIYLIISIFSILSIIGIICAISYWVLSKRFLLPIIGIIGNGLILLFAFFLLLAMGIGEP